jgi:hypothetical protein
MSLDPAAHKRFLDYRERYEYFGRKGTTILTAAEFEAAETELRALDAKADGRDDEEDERWAALRKILFRD